MRNFRLDDESGHQEALFSWAAYQQGRMPELEYLHHVPNGGKRDKATATALKRQGVKAGVPDIVLPAVRAGYHGLYIELKAGKNTVATHLSCPKINQIDCHRMSRYNGISLKKGKVPGHLQFRHR